MSATLLRQTHTAEGFSDGRLLEASMLCALRACRLQKQKSDMGEVTYPAAALDALKRASEVSRDSVNGPCHSSHCA